MFHCAFGNNNLCEISTGEGEEKELTERTNGIGALLGK